MTIQPHWWPEVGINEHMNLVQKQKIMAKLVGKLLTEAYVMGYEVTLGEAWRPQVTADYYAKHGTGIRNSLHTQRLALDINLFKNGKFLTNSDDYAKLGEWWEQLGPSNNVLTCWGGRFKSRDGNHFSIEDNGVK